MKFSEFIQKLACFSGDRTIRINTPNNKRVFKVKRDDDYDIVATDDKGNSVNIEDIATMCMSDLENVEFIDDETYLYRALVDDIYEYLYSHYGNEYVLKTADIDSIINDTVDEDIGLESFNTSIQTCVDNYISDNKR